MAISEKEKSVAKIIINTLLQHQVQLPYVNIIDGRYSGWVSDFHLSLRDGSSIKLDLTCENDLFSLFALALAWSRPGHWENAAYFVAYLKINKKDTPEYWIDQFNCNCENELRQGNAQRVSGDIHPLVPPRQKIAFRKDIFDSMRILALNWPNIIDGLASSQSLSDYRIFFTRMRSIIGLGTGTKTMLIKLPLILRELRCQNIHNNIPGRFCCVADERVLNAASALGISLIKPSNQSTLIETSSKIYDLFGDLYDIPLFAYNDLQHFM